MSAGALIRTRRESLGMTQSDLAVLARTAQSAISRIETGMVSPTIRMVEHLLGATGARLILTYDADDELGEVRDE